MATAARHPSLTLVCSVSKRLTPGAFRSAAAIIPVVAAAGVWSALWLRAQPSRQPQQLPRSSLAVSGTQSGRRHAVVAAAAACQRAVVTPWCRQVEDEDALAKYCSYKSLRQRRGSTPRSGCSPVPTPAHARVANRACASAFADVVIVAPPPALTPDPEIGLNLGPNTRLGYAFEQQSAAMLSPLDLLEPHTDLALEEDLAQVTQELFVDSSSSGTSTAAVTAQAAVWPGHVPPRATAIVLDDDFLVFSGLQDPLHINAELVDSLAEARWSYCGPPSRLSSGQQQVMTRWAALARKRNVKAQPLTYGPPLLLSDAVARPSGRVGLQSPLVPRRCGHKPRGAVRAQASNGNRERRFVDVASAALTEASSVRSVEACTDATTLLTGLMCAACEAPHVFSHAPVTLLDSDGAVLSIHDTRPITLPACGHSVCVPCAETCAASTPALCPICGAAIGDVACESLPGNAALCALAHAVVSAGDVDGAVSAASATLIAGSNTVDPLLTPTTARCGSCGDAALWRCGVRCEELLCALHGDGHARQGCADDSCSAEASCEPPPASVNDQLWAYSLFPDTFKAQTIDFAAVRAHCGSSALQPLHLSSSGVCAEWDALVAAAGTHHTTTTEPYAARHAGVGLACACSRCCAQFIADTAPHRARVCPACLEICAAFTATVKAEVQAVHSTLSETSDVMRVRVGKYDHAMAAAKALAETARLSVVNKFDRLAELLELHRARTLSKVGEMHRTAMKRLEADRLCYEVSLGQCVAGQCVAQAALHSDNTAAMLSAMADLKALVKLAAVPWKQPQSRTTTVDVDTQQVDGVLARCVQVSEGTTGLASVVGHCVRTLAIDTNAGVGNGVAVSEDNAVLAVSHQNHKISTYAMDSGKHIATFSQEGLGKGLLSCPTKLCFTAGGNLLVAEMFGKRVQELTVDGLHVRFVGVGVITDGIGSVACSSEYIAVGKCNNWGEDRIMLFSAPTGAFVRAFGEYGSCAGQLMLCCTAVRFTPDSQRIVVAETDRSEGRLSVFTTTGQFVRCVGAGTLAPVGDVEITDNGALVVSDCSPCARISVFSPDSAELLLRWFEAADSSTEACDCIVDDAGAATQHPAALATRCGLLYVLDRDAATVRVFE